MLGPDVELPGDGGRSGRASRERPTCAPSASSCSPVGSRFEVEGTPVELRVPGRHNVLNALAALAACRAAGVEPAEAAAALADFDGAGRRFEDHGRTPRGALVYDDYAHHPTEVRATLEAARTLARRGPPPGRLLPAAPLLAHARCSRATSAARWRSPTSWWCSTSTRRASAPRTSPA